MRQRAAEAAARVEAGTASQGDRQVVAERDARFIGMAPLIRHVPETPPHCCFQTAEQVDRADEEARRHIAVTTHGAIRRQRAEAIPAGYASEVASALARGPGALRALAGRYAEQEAAAPEWTDKRRAELAALQAWVGEALDLLSGPDAPLVRVFLPRLLCQMARQVVRPPTRAASDHGPPPGRLVTARPAAPHGPPPAVTDARYSGRVTAAAA